MNTVVKVAIIAVASLVFLVVVGPSCWELFVAPILDLPGPAAILAGPLVCLATLCCAKVWKQLRPQSRSPNVILWTGIALSPGADHQKCAKCGSRWTA